MITISLPIANLIPKDIPLNHRFLSLSSTVSFTSLNTNRFNLSLSPSFKCISIDSRQKIVLTLQAILYLGAHVMYFLYKMTKSRPSVSKVRNWGTSREGLDQSKAKAQHGKDQTVSLHSRHFGTAIESLALQRTCHSTSPALSSCTQHKPSLLWASSALWLQHSMAAIPQSWNPQYPMIPIAA